MKKRIFSILLCICMVCSLLPVTAGAEEGVTKKVAVGSIVLLDDQCIASNNAVVATDGINNGSYVAYFKDDTLYLNNLQISNGQIKWTANNEDNSAAAYDLTIDLTGSNKVTNNSGIAIAGETGWVTGNGMSLTIQGDGSLTATGSTKGIWVWKNITIQGNATVIASGNNYGICNNSNIGKITITESAEVNASSNNYGVGYDNSYNNSSVQISGGSLTAIGGTAAFRKAPILDTGVTAQGSANTMGTDAETYISENNDSYKWVKSSFSAPVTYTVDITGGTGMTTSGNTSQTIEQDSAMTDVVYTAADGYYFPNDYTVSEQNGINVTRNSFTQITVSGTPTANVNLTLNNATAKAKETTPTATFTATGSDTGTLSGVASGMKYSINDGSSWTNIDSDADVNLTSLSACTISVVKKGGDTTTDSDAQTITVTKAAAPSTIVGVGCTSDSNNDGKLQNVMTAMEYKLSTADNWTAGTGSDITGLANGTYDVRVKANGTALASDYQTVTVPAYTAPVYSVSLDTSGTHTFSAAVVGYGAQTAKTVTVRNTGNTATGALTVTLSGSNTDSFTLSKTGIDSIAESGNDTFTIVPNTGLAAGTYTATVTVSGGNGITANFNVSFTVNTAGGGDNGNGGGWYDYDYTPPSYKVEDVTPDKADGSITSDHTNAQKGDDVTITVTPDRYYNVDGVIVKDKNGKEIPVTMNQDGTFSFEMPAGEVTVEPIFVWDNPFVDVDEETEDAEPVEWALKNGITTGATDITFAPDGDCTRAQIVTFLWRAAGSPEPTGTSQSFADVDADDYFAKAVLWALENGITTGVTDTTFAPNAVCTRAQTVTFLHRAAGKPATEQGSAFDDVTADSYYAQAVAWAEANGITKGIGGSLFGSLDECTRIQIVTFLYRFLGELTD